MANRLPLSKSLLMYIGIVLLLTGTISAKGEDMGIILLGGIAILLLDVIEFKQLPYEKSILVRLILGSSLLLVGIIKLVESIGKNFTANHLFLIMILIGLILILIEDLKRYQGIPEGVK